MFAGGRYGRARGAKYDRVQTEEEGRSLVDDDLGDFDVEGDVAPVQRDRRGNPVAKAIVSEGPCATASVLVCSLVNGHFRIYLTDARVSVQGRRPTARNLSTETRPAMCDKEWPQALRAHGL